MKIESHSCPKKTNNDTLTKYIAIANQSLKVNIY